jgi:NAD-dependent dihydropyrimidine dehydrogenase PreA subunit
MLQTLQKARKRGFGLQDWVKSNTSIKGKKWRFAEIFFTALVMAGPLTKSRVLDAIIKRVALMTDKHPSAGFSVPLNIDLSDSCEQVTVPIDLMKQTARNASFVAVINECVCRHTFNCVTYPHDLGCMFLGEGARVTVANGIAREVTAEEACAHIDKAASLGLAGGAFWVEVEQYVWGFKDEDREKHLEFCFCCPCCCGAFKYEINAHGRTKHLLHKSIGWRCTVNDDCQNCGSCLEACPRQLIRLGDDRAIIDDECSGCGICVSNCPAGALSVAQVGPMKSNLVDYFEGLNLKL